MKRLNFRKVVFVCALSVVFFLLTGCSKKAITPVSKNIFIFDTVVTLTLYEVNEQSDYSMSELIEQAELMCMTYENLFSRTLEGSDIWNINHNAGQWTEVSQETITVIQTAISYAEVSNGMLDITIAPVVDLWNFEDEDSMPPSALSISEALTHVNYRNIEFKDSGVRLTDANAKIDLGCIAKGYIADALYEFWVENGVTSAIINLGGNIMTIGRKPDNTLFQIGIQKPFEPSGTALMRVFSEHNSIVTSGIYERYFTYKGVLYHHVLNPATGYPVESDLLSVTILAPASIDADALSTMCLLLGYEEGKRHIQSLDGIDAIFITKDEMIYDTRKESN